MGRQGIKTVNATAMFQDWEVFRNVIRQGINQQCFEIGNSPARL